MAGLSGKTAYVAGAKQTAKGTPAALAVYKNAFAGGSVAPVRETDRLSETDSSRDQSAAYVTTTGVEGSPELYVRPKSIGFWLWAALGTDVATGTMPNFIHTMVPGTALPWLTLWKLVGAPAASGGLLERYQDCQVGSISVSAEAGAPLTATVGIQGLIPTRISAADPNLAVAMDSDTVFNYNNGAITLGGGASTLIRSFEFTLENNLTRQQTDDVTPIDIAAGQREISLGFDMLFADYSEYNKFHYGGAAGTTVSPSIFTTSASFTYTIDANTEISFTFPSIAYEEFPVDPDPGGDPIVVSARAVAQKATGITDLVTVVVKNSVASY